MRHVTIDLRPRCKRCGKLPRGKLQDANYARYAPYCSYHCQQWARLEGAQQYIASLRDAESQGTTVANDKDKQEQTR